MRATGGIPKPVKSMQVAKGFQPTKITTMWLSISWMGMLKSIMLLTVFMGLLGYQAMPLPSSSTTVTTTTFTWSTTTVEEEEVPKRVWKKPDQNKKIHITHLFNSFNTKKGSSLWGEQEMVRLSWQLAAEAARGHGIEVEFLNAVLSMDELSHPSFARKYVLKDQVVDPFNKHVLPTIGEIFTAGMEKGRGDILVYTNADIGTMEDFYVKVWDLYHRDYREESLQKSLFEESNELLHFCLDFKPEDKLGSAQLCQEDMREFYLLHGGSKELLPSVQRSAAILYVKKKVQELNGKVSSKQVSDWYAAAGGPLQSANSDLDMNFIINYSYSPVPRASLSSEPKPNAFTLTRMDLVASRKNITFTVDGLRSMLEKAKSQPHPGNDCFVMPRSMVPESIRKSRHPLSWRPWGMWIPPTFEWEFADAGLVWRRYEGTATYNFTFHLGVSGRVAKNWIDLFNRRPLFILKLVAEWNDVTKGKYLEQYYVPEYCKDERVYRHFSFCNKSPQHMKYCQGNVRYGCSKYVHPHLRDPYNYVLACERFLRRASEKKGQYLVEPYCTFCSGLFQIWGASSSKIKSVSKNCNHNYRLVDCQERGKCVFEGIKII